MNSETEYLDLLDLQGLLKEGIEDLVPDGVWVKAEIAQLQARSNGHCYLDLVQSENGVQLAKARAVIWRSKWPFLRAFYKQTTGSDLAAGQQVLVEVEVSYSELYGLTLVIDDINPEFTIGDAQKKRQETIDKLSSEGLLEKQKELVLPALPYRLAVISAQDAAGFGDFERHLSENEYGFVFDVKLFPAVMQGQTAPESICDALDSVQCESPSFDAVLILRGGGSNLDLACYDDYALAFTIANCPIPVFTAIGHDRDYHVADMVACRFLKTPTALADEFIALYVEEDSRISGLLTRLQRAFALKILREETRLDHLAERISSADPRNVLMRGYTLVTDSKGVVLKSSSVLSKGDTIRVLMTDGRIEATINKIDSEDEN